jgi:cytochrome b561
VSTLPQRYTPTAIALHWLVAVFIVANLLGGLYMTGLTLSPQKLKYFSWHKWAGVTIFALSALRLLWRLSHAAPALPGGMPAWQRSAAHASQQLRGAVGQHLVHVHVGLRARPGLPDR